MDLPVLTIAANRPKANPHFERLGGAAVVERLVESFYRAMDTRRDAERIRRMHRPDLAEVRRVLVAYLTEWLGGPRLYSPERGAPRLGRVHHPFRIGPAERDAWMACMGQALAETCADVALRAELHAAFWKVAQHLASHADTPQPVNHDAFVPDTPH